MGHLSYATLLGPLQGQCPSFTLSTVLTGTFPEPLVSTSQSHPTWVTLRALCSPPHWIPGTAGTGVHAPSGYPVGKGRTDDPHSSHRLTCSFLKTAHTKPLHCGLNHLPPGFRTPVLVLSIVQKHQPGQEVS